MALHADVPKVFTVGRCLLTQKVMSPAQGRRHIVFPSLLLVILNSSMKSSTLRKRVPEVLLGSVQLFGRPGALIVSKLVLLAAFTVGVELPAAQKS